MVQLRKPTTTNRVRKSKVIFKISKPGESIKMNLNNSFLDVQLKFMIHWTLSRHPIKSENEIKKNAETRYLRGHRCIAQIWATVPIISINSVVFYREILHFHNTLSVHWLEYIQQNFLLSFSNQEEKDLDYDRYYAPHTHMMHSKMSNS